MANYIWLNMKINHLIMDLLHIVYICKSKSPQHINFSKLALMCQGAIHDFTKNFWLIFTICTNYRDLNTKKYIKIS